MEKKGIAPPKLVYVRAWTLLVHRLDYSTSGSVPGSLLPIKALELMFDQTYISMQLNRVALFGTHLEWEATGRSPSRYGGELAFLWLRAGTATTCSSIGPLFEQFPNSRPTAIFTGLPKHIV